MAATWPSTTFVAGAVLTAAQLNTYLRDNTDDLNSRVSTSVEAVQAAEVGTAETTTSTSFTDLATTGPQVTLATGTKVLVTLNALMSNNTSGQNSVMGLEVSGASTVAAAPGPNTLQFESDPANQQARTSAQILLTSTDGMVAGSNTFTAKYRCDGGTSTFSRRVLVVFPLTST